jgi:hypothetical protein
MSSCCGSADVLEGGSSSPVPGDGRHRLYVCPPVPPGDEVCRCPPPRYRHPHRI